MEVRARSKALIVPEYIGVNADEFYGYCLVEKIIPRLYVHIVKYCRITAEVAKPNMCGLNPVVILVLNIEISHLS